MGLQEDIKLRGDNYQWLGSMFYFGWSPYLLADTIAIKADHGRA